MAKIVRLDKIQASYNGNLEHVKFAADQQNGAFFVDGGLVAGERELINGVAPTDVTKQEILLLAHPEVMYDPRKAGLKDFVLEAGVAGRGYHLTEGDIITLTIDCFDGTPVVGKYVVPQNGQFELAPAADLSGGTKFAAKVIEETTLGYDATQAFAIKVVQV